VLQKWKNLQKHFEQVKDITIRDYFNQDPHRGNKFKVLAEDLYVDYSKHRISQNTMELLFKLARGTNLSLAIENMFTGKKINKTEDRPVLHIALRNRSNTSIIVEPIKHIVNIGIGGSDLGPAMVYEALKPYSQSNLTIDFVSNIDSTHICECLKNKSPEETLFIIASKTFTTQETMTNANTAKNWLISHLKENGATARHFIALSTNYFMLWTSTSETHHLKRIFLLSWLFLVSGIIIFIMPKAMQFFHTTNISIGFRPIFNKLIWKVTVNL